MTTPARLRTADRLKQSDFEASGFTARKNKPARVLECLFIGLSLGFLCSIVVLYYNVLTGFYLLLGAALVIVIINIQLQRLKFLQQSAEFLNAILSSALNDGFRFSMVIRDNGEMIYLNRGFQNMFPKFIVQEQLTLTEWGNTQQLSAADREQLANIVSSGTKSRLSLILHTGEAHQQEAVSLLIAPVLQPKGYAIIRGE